MEGWGHLLLKGKAYFTVFIVFQVENQPRKDEAMEDDTLQSEGPSISQPAPTLLSTLATDELLRKTAASAVNDVKAPTESMELDPTDDNFFAALQEAVADQSEHDLAAEFAAEKKEVEAEEDPEDLDTFLPGWNRWTGPGTEAADEAIRKKKLIKAPKRRRKDRAKPKVIIRERVNEELKKHLVSVDCQIQRWTQYI